MNNNLNKNFWNKKKVFITGHTGFKGSWLCLFLHYLGAEVTGYSLTPNTKPNLFDLAKVDQIIDSATDITNLISPTVREKDEIIKKEMRKKLTNKLLPRWFNYLENLLQKEINSPWFVDNKMSIADIAMWRLQGWLKSGMLDGNPKNIFANYPKLNNVHAEVHKHPKVQEWMLKTYGNEI